jgi:hypothetical protein
MAVLLLDVRCGGKPVYGVFRRRRYSARALARVHKAQFYLFFSVPAAFGGGHGKNGIVGMTRLPGVNAGPNTAFGGNGHEWP